MNLPRFAPLFASLLMLGLTSCPETNVPRDFGVKPVVLKPAEWEGDWADVGGTPDGKGHVTIKQADQGLLSIPSYDKDGKASGEAEVMVRQASTDKNSHLFFMSSFDKPGASVGSVSLMSKSDDNVFYLWSPNHEAIAKAIASGRLKGKATKAKDQDGMHSQLDAVASNYRTLLLPEFWDWTSPTAIFKQPKSKPKGK